MGSIIHRMHPRAAVASLAAAVGVACSPELNWREVKLAQTRAAALFPCRPSAQTRQVAVAGSSVPWSLHACSAAGLTFAIGNADLGDTARVEPALDQLLASARANLGVRGDAAAAEATVPGASAARPARRVLLNGQRRDGATLVEHLLLFADGARVYQATVIGPKSDAEAAEVFFGSIRLKPR